MKVMFTVQILGQTRIVTFTVLGHFWSSYKVIFDHLYSSLFGHVNNPPMNQCTFSKQGHYITYIFESTQKCI